MQILYKYIYYYYITYITYYYYKWKVDEKLDLLENFRNKVNRRDNNCVDSYTERPRFRQPNAFEMK